MAVTWNTVTYGQSKSGLSDLANGTTGTYVSPATQANAQRLVNEVDPEATAANAANAYRNAAESSLSDAQSTVSTAYGNLQKTNSGLQSALSGLITDGAEIDDYLQAATENYGKINQYAEEAKTAANGMDESISAVKDNASQITNIADSLGDYAPILKAMGTSMFDTGGNLISSGTDYINQAQALLGLDTSSGGLAGTYAQVLAQLDPSLAVTTAANDTKTAYENADAATQRSLARQGVSSGSGQSVALKQQAAQSLATALAAIKTKTRQSSTESYLSALRGAVADASTLGSTGSSIASQGVTAQAQGANAVNSAAGILVSQGQLYGSAASANASAGNLQASKANALTSAGQLTTSAGNLAISAANAKVSEMNARVNAASTSGTIAANEMSAANSVASQQNTAASYYAGMFNSYATLAGDSLFG